MLIMEPTIYLQYWH